MHFPRAVLTSALAAVVSSGVLAAWADDLRAPMPEPILTESVTDLDAREGGELELALNAYLLAARERGARSRQVSVEIEYRVTPGLGLRLEPSYARPSASTVGDGAKGEAGIGAAVGVTLVHDFAHDFHLQAELSGRAPREPDPGHSSALGEPVLPFDAMLRAGARWGAWTFRPAVGFELGGPVAHLPLRAAASLLTPFGSDDGGAGFFGVEVEVDGARVAPLTIAPNFVADLSRFELPLRLGVAVPWIVGAEAVQPNVGVYWRLLLVTDREAEFARGGPRSPR